MKETRKGHIINIVSMAGLIATISPVFTRRPEFAAIGFSNPLRLELMTYGIYA